MEIQTESWLLQEFIKDFVHHNPWNKAYGSSFWGLGSQNPLVALLQK